MTRWASQIYSCKALKSTLDIVLLLLNNLVLEKSNRSSEAIGLLNMINFQFVYLLYLFVDLLSEVHITSKYLQDSNADISKAIILIQTTKDLFNKRRNDPEAHHNFYMEVQNKTISLNIKLPSEKHKQTRTKKVPKHLEKFVYSVVNIEKQNNITVNDFKINIYNLILDRMITEMDKGFINNEDLLSANKWVQSRSYAIFKL